MKDLEQGSDMIKHSFQEEGSLEGGLRCGEDDMSPGQEGGPKAQV